MTDPSLASCRMIPQEITVAIAGDVHIDGLILAVVLILLVVICKKL